MKIIVILLNTLVFTNANPYAESKVWRWVPKMPTVNSNARAYSNPDVILTPKKLDRINGHWRATTCGSTAALTPAIVNGSEVIPHSYPWQVALFIDDAFFCGGTLISDEWILTAGHCISGSSSIVIVLGAHDLSQNEATQVSITSTGSDIITHPDYGEALLRNDVGLVHLSNPVNFTSAIQPICLPAYSDVDLGVGILLTATGWGKTSDNSVGISDTLNQVTNPSISNADCKTVYGARVTAATICTDTAKGNQGTCGGDSGGPLNYIVGGRTFSRGVSSYVDSSGCAAGYPDGFTRTTHYLDWIETTTGITINT